MYYVCDRVFSLHLLSSTNEYSCFSFSQIRIRLIVLQYGLFWKLDDDSAELSSNLCVCVHKMVLLFLATDLMWNYFS